MKMTAEQKKIMEQLRLWVPNLLLLCDFFWFLLVLLRQCVLGEMTPTVAILETLCNDLPWSIL